jgi:hypothetical protein
MEKEFMGMIYAAMIGPYEIGYGDLHYERIAKEAIKAAKILSDQISLFEHQAIENQLNGVETKY